MMASLKKGDCVTVAIEDIGDDGAGIGKALGYTLFIKDTVIGDVVEAKVVKAKKSYGYARLLRVVEPSADRVEPRCPVARQCGGCQLQEMAYPAQLRFKQDLVRNCLARIGGLYESDYEMYPIIGMDEPYHYRNKAQFPVGTDKSGRLVIGFYAGRTHYVVECMDCCIGEPVNRKILESVRSFMEENHISSYDEEKHSGIVRHVLIRTGRHTKEIMVCIIINLNKLPHSRRLVEKLAGIEHMASIMVNVNTQKTNAILGSHCETLWGQPFISDRIGSVWYQISPLSFFQVNPIQTEKIYNKVLEFAQLTGAETVWDLYCGIGTISLFLASRARKVYGVESVGQAVEDARHNAARNGIENVEFFVGKAEDVVPAFYEEMLARENAGDAVAGQDIRPHVVVVDPPRKGCAESLLATIVQMAPERIVYVSCNPATLARDLKYLAAAGYVAEKVQPVDQFGHTVHVETVVGLQRKDT